MADVWGQMPKSQDDSEKIEEAISRMIAEHEADPQAHLGAGESLEAHRANEIIDHPAGSVLADKTTFKEDVATTFFENMDAWYTQGTVGGSFRYLNITVFGNSSVDSYAYNDLFDFWPTDDPIEYLPADNMLQVPFYYNRTLYNGLTRAVADIYLGLGVPDRLNWFIGFKIVDDEIYFGLSQDDDIVWSSPIPYVNGRHVFRVQTSKLEKACYFYLDGVLVHSADMSNLPDWSYTTFGVWLKKISGTIGQQYSSITLSSITIANAK